MITHNTAQTGPRNQGKITINKISYYCIQTSLDNKDWIFGLKITQLLKNYIKSAYLTYKTLHDISLKTDSTSILT